MPKTSDYHIKELFNGHQGLYKDDLCIKVFRNEEEKKAWFAVRKVPDREAQDWELAQSIRRL